MPTKQERITITDNGTINIPIELLAQYGLKVGDQISVVPLDSGLLIGDSEKVGEQLLDYMGNRLRSKGITFDDLIADRDQIQNELLKEEYSEKLGIEVDE